MVMSGPRAAAVIQPAGLQEIFLLGHEIRLAYADGTPDRTVTQPKIATLLVRLLLAPNMKAPSTALVGELWPRGTQGSLEQAVTSLRRDYGVPIPQKTGATYGLAIGRDQVDALRFVDEVEALADKASPAELDPLMAAWQADPRGLYEIPDGLWRPLSAALDRVVALVAGLAGKASDLRVLPAFAAVFPSECRLPAVGGAGSKLRLLIVEDQIADLFADHLGDHDCRLVRSLRKFWELANSGPLEFDCALVDQHLKPTMDDFGGYRVCEHLRDNTQVPAILMSLSKLPVRGPHQRLIRDLRLFGLYSKADDQTLDGLRDMISEAVQQDRA
jgi:CheY-like chemotaxis protein